VPVNTGSGLDAAQAAKLNSLDTSKLDATISSVKTDLGTMNTGVQKASKLIPYSDGL
jgi:hypothetical protein